MQGAPVASTRTLTSRAGRTTPAFRPWHFFVLASLIAATVAVDVSRRLDARAPGPHQPDDRRRRRRRGGLYRMLAPLPRPTPRRFSEPLSVRARAALEREKTLVLRSIKELEFDRAMGKLSPRDFDEMAAGCAPAR